MKKILLLLFIANQSFSQSYTSTEISVNELITGTLFQPNKPTAHLVIVIAGSGPTNRSGNQIGLHNNALKYLSEGIATEGFAVFAYDKRLFKLISQPGFKEDDILFDQMVADASAVVQHFRKNYKKIIIAGHSEGSLIGMLASQDVDGFISIAGPAKPAADILEEQLAKQIPAKMPIIRERLDKLRQGITFTENDIMLQSLFRNSVQPYLISWFRYNPQLEIQKLQIPTLILQGTKDLQVNENEAELLRLAQPKSKVVIIKNMNHILKEIEGSDIENKASYNQPNLPTSKALIDAVNEFIKTI
jgi:pimeloyl-ACP methyl ester carboxylesterase